MADLVVIEAPGKLRTVRRGLAANYVRVDVVATLGHVRGYDRRLAPLGIVIDAEQTLSEDRHILRPNVRRFLAAAIGKADRIVIATDGDQEGHAIAVDVAALVHEVAPHAAMYRMVPSGLDPESLGEAWRSAVPFSPVEAQAGIARRVADRVFAASLSDPEQGVVIGRVQLGLLQMCADGRACRQVATLPVPAADGGRPFLATVDVPAGVSQASVQEAFASIAPVRVQGEAYLAPLQAPMDAADALLALDAELSMSIDDAARFLQEMYENGEISYPRTGSHAFTGMGANAVARLAQVRGILGFRRDVVPQMDAGAHEAIRLVGTRAAPDLMRPPCLAPSVTDGVKTIIGRRMVESGIEVQREDGDCSQLPLWASGARLVREMVRTRPGWQSGPPSAVSIRERSPEAALVAAMAGAGVGRPSTYSRHATRFMATGWVDEDLSLTGEGRRVLSSIPGDVCRAAATGAFERAVDAPGTIVERAERALAVLGVAPVWETNLVAAEQVDDARAPRLEPEPPHEAPEYEDDEEIPVYGMG